MQTMSKRMELGWPWRGDPGREGSKKEEGHLFASPSGKEKMTFRLPQVQKKSGVEPKKKDDPTAKVSFGARRGEKRVLVPRCSWEGEIAELREYQ